MTLRFAFTAVLFLIGCGICLSRKCPTGESPRNLEAEKQVPCTGPYGWDCCCNEFVQGMIGNRNLGASRMMFQTLPKIGWCRCSGCVVGAVAVNTGHSAFAHSCSDGKVSTFGANQSCERYGGCQEVCGCSNVNVWSNQPQSRYTYFHPSCCWSGSFLNENCVFSPFERTLLHQRIPLNPK